MKSRLIGLTAAAVTLLLASCGELLFGGFERADSPDVGGAGDAAFDVDADARQDSGFECNQPGDCPGDDTECTKRACSAGRCSEVTAPSGTECSQGGVLCDGNGACVNCRVNGRKDLEETDTDCGGGLCPGCTAGLLCKNGADCSSGICRPNPSDQSQTICFDAQCSDDRQNGDETDIDCGGSRCPACVRGMSCQLATDCESGFCSRGVCCGVACSRSCERCEPGSGVCDRIPAGTDPEDAFCPGVTNYCTDTGRCSSCTNRERDTAAGMEEADIDCGGPLCGPCPDSNSCTRAEECQSCICENGQCQAKRCNNHLLDGCETDVDCGGACTAPCGLGRQCKSKTDCASYSCVNGLCIAP